MTKNGKSCWYLLKYATVQTNFREVGMPINDQADKNDRSSPISNRIRIEFQEQNEFICIFKKNYKIAYASPSPCHYFRQKPEKLIEKNFLDSIFKNEGRAIDHQLSMLAAHNPHSAAKSRASV